jgi:phenylacetate-CoA ligase
LRLWRWAGIAFGRPFATLLGKPIVPVGQSRPPFWRYNASWNHLLLSCLHLKEENIPHYVGAMRDRKIEMLETYPSAAFLVARFLEAPGDHLPLLGLMLNGEPLLPFEREVIEERFQCRAFDAYSQAERVVFAGECERHDGMHISSEFGICEIVDASGNPVAPGHPGLIAGTILRNLGMPLIRYTFNDVAVRTERQCECGRTLPMLEGLATREEDILVAPDGRMIPPVMLSWGFRLVRGVRRAQLAQHSRDRLLVRLELDEPIRADDEAEFRRYLRGKFGDGMTFEIERVDEIPLSPRGKYRRVISTVPLRWGHIETPNLHRDGAA